MARRAVLVLLAAVALAGCGDDDPEAITVAAAASLTDAFTEIGAGFEAEHPGAEVTFTFDSSGTLAEQIAGGAPADVFASADEADVERVSELVDGEPVVFARNELAIVTQPGNPEGITSLADLAEVGVVALCSEDAPCGRVAQEVLDAAGVVLPEGDVTRGQNASATLTAVSEGDAVAGIVYVTDARRAGGAVEAVAIPPDQNTLATYPIAALGGSELAGTFVAYVASEAGQRVLEEHGFLPPR